jgi:hypothetical protein
MVNRLLYPDRLTINHRPGSGTFFLESASAIRTNTTYANPLHLVSILLADAGPPVTFMTSLATAAIALMIVTAIGLNWHLRRGRGRAEKALFGCSLLITQSGFETDKLFLKLIDLPLLVQALFTVRHLRPCRANFLIFLAVALIVIRTVCGQNLMTGRREMTEIGTSTWPNMNQ